MNNVQKFKRLSFWQLLGETPIDIPLIQRAYAQGRVRKEALRKKFLSTLLNAFINKPVELDFVYGSTLECEFQPLDGQQRLTTLFLLHWYIAVLEGRLDEDTKHRLKRFTYETRSSSREFCHDLVVKSVMINENKISHTIKNAPWYVMSWSRDPSINGMLKMLDDIQETFSGNVRIWDRLTDAENPPITFLYLPLEEFGLSDDLYIKMNARGKQLTSFEHFKARFEKHIEVQKWELDLSLEDTFSYKIDTEWTDTFWFHRGDNDLVDEELMNFIAGTAINLYALESDQNEYIEERIKNLYNDSNLLEPEDYPSKESFNYLKVCLNIYSQKDTYKPYTESLLPADFALWESKPGIFEEFVTDSERNITYKTRALFFAQTEYLLTNVFEQNTFTDWMRVIRNIVHNDVTGIATFTKAIKLIRELSAGSGSIYQYLSKNKFTLPHTSKQVLEEIFKSKLIVTDISYKPLIFEAEDFQELKGNITELLATCMGKEHLTIEDDMDEISVEKLKKVVAAYKCLSSNYFISIWGDLLNTDVYHSKYGIWRLEYHEHPEKHSGFLKLVAEKSRDENADLSLEEFCIKREKEFVRQQIKEFGDLSLVNIPRHQIYLYYIIWRRFRYNRPTLTESSERKLFFRGGFNFGWLSNRDKSTFHSLFNGFSESYKIPDPIFQTYSNRFYHSKGLKRENALPLEIESTKGKYYLAKLSEWSREDS